MFELNCVDKYYTHKGIRVSCNCNNLIRVCSACVHNIIFICMCVCIPECKYKYESPNTNGLDRYFRSN